MGCVRAALEALGDLERRLKVVTGAAKAVVADKDTGESL
jgi:hypothetical protein